MERNDSSVGSAVVHCPFTLELVATLNGDEVDTFIPAGEPLTGGAGLDVRLLGGGAVAWTGATQLLLTSTVDGNVLPWVGLFEICP